MKHYDIRINGLVESSADSAVIVVSIAPDDQERAWIKDSFSLDDYDVGGTLDADEVPRLESSAGRLFLIWKVPESASVSNGVELGISTLGVCLAQNRLLLVRASGDAGFIGREFRGVQTAADVMLALLLRTVKHFVGHLRAIRQMSGELEKKITTSMENTHLLQMFALSEDLVYYQDAIEGNAAVLSKLRGVAGQFGFEARQLELLDDIVLENAQAARQASIFSVVLSGLMDARGTIVNNNMNVLLKNLTLINIVFLPLNLIASIGGMSEWSMMTAGMDWRLSYLLFSFAMVVIGWGTWIIMRKFIDRNIVRKR
ncbi:magnesium transporter CorA family protein [bacterium]|nr:magnesium transporter CorA family protein [bacterium]